MVHQKVFEVFDAYFPNYSGEMRRHGLQMERTVSVSD